MSHKASNKLNRVAIITGVSSGIGRALATQFCQEGIKVLGISRTLDALQSLKKELLDNFHFLHADITEEGVIDKLFEACHASFSSYPDIVVANAGRGIKGRISDVDLDEFDEVLNVNYRSTLRLLQKSAKTLRTLKAEKKDIVVVGSVSGTNISPFSSAYGTTKIAIHWAVEALRRELAVDNIRTTLLVPGVIETNFQSTAGYDEKLTTAFKDNFGPLLLATEVASLVSSVLNLPQHMNVGELVIRPTKQDYP